MVNRWHDGSVMRREPNLVVLPFLPSMIPFGKMIFEPIVEIGFPYTIAKLLFLQSFGKCISLLHQGFDFRILRSLGFFICKFNSILCLWFCFIDYLLVFFVSTHRCHGFPRSPMMANKQEGGEQLQWQR
jgi:hypothetical protein